MGTYIAFLRGINVSGQKPVKMAELKKHLEELDFSDVQTYIQSGNIVFSSPQKDPAKLAGEITQLIRKKYDFEVPAIVLTRTEIEHVIRKNPFAKNEDPDKLYFTFLSEKPTKAALEKIDAAKYAPEAFEPDGKVIYFFSPTGYGHAKMNNNFFEKKLSCTATTRNLKTLVKMVELAGG